MARCHYCAEEVNTPKKRFCDEKCHLLKHTEVKENGCWDYKGFKDKYGYAHIKIGGKTKYAHRISYKIHKGKIEDGLNVCHKCDNTACVNPDHLWLGTAKDNMQDMIRKGRKADKKGENHHMNKLTEKDVIEIRELLSEKELTQTKIAGDYSVSPGCISLINSKKLWAHI